MNNYKIFVKFCPDGRRLLAVLHVVNSTSVSYTAYKYIISNIVYLVKQRIFFMVSRIKKMVYYK